MTLDLAAARARKKEAEAAITAILQELCEELRPGNVGMELNVSRLEQRGEDAPVSIMFHVKITCEV
jgi:hypothetical protein